jgi:Ethanolamine utilization protein EutJ (predicted chaperonin)
MKGPFSRLGRIWATLRKPKSQPKPQLLPDTPSPALPKVAPSEKQASPQRKLTERTLRRYERHLIVGVDFGTSSTKVIWQDLSGPYFELFRWRPELNGLDSVLLPSTVSVRGGTLVFGSPAPLDGDVWLPSIKLCVLCIRNASVCRCDASAATRGQIRLPGRNAGAPAEALACLFLAFVLQTVEKHLEKIFPNDDVILIWNIGCPMDHLDALDSRSSWHKMAGVAMQLRGRISNPAGLSLLDEAIQLMSIFVPPSDPNFFIQPEGMAAIKAFLESPRGAEAKTYAIVDVGAGTTEVSFFFNGSIQSKGGLLQPSYLADSNEAVGGGKFDIELARKWRCDVESARRRKEQGKEQIPYVESLGAIRQQYDLTCRKILKERKLTAKDNKRFDLFIIGGGGRLPILRDLLTRCQLPGDFVREHTRQLTPPTNLRNRADVEAHYDLLANACGLASSLDWEYYPPREVPPMLPPRSGMRHDRDELYPK